MDFWGWGLKLDQDTPDIVYGSVGMTSVYTPYNSQEPIYISETPIGTVIDLYAIWKTTYDNSTILYCYYPKSTTVPGTAINSNNYISTGGIKPEIQNGNNVSRSTSIYDGVINHLCIDIPSSGYTMNWEWDNINEVTEEAIYEGNSKISNKIEGNTYTSTEAGTIKLKGSFKNLTVSIENGDKMNIEIQKSSKFVKIYNINFTRKDLAGSIVKKSDGTDLEWMTGADGIFNIPDHIESYLEMGILDPCNKSANKLGTTNYGNLENKNAKFYLKKAIVTDISVVNENGNTRSYNLGDRVIVPDDEKTYCFYPCFGAKNYKYRVYNEANGDYTYYYHENLKEAYDDICEKNATDLYVCNNVNPDNVITKIQSEEDVYWKYIAQYDPSWGMDVYFGKNKEINIHTSSYYIGRAKSIVISSGGEVTLNGESGGGIKFANYFFLTGRYAPNYSNILIRDENSSLKIENNFQIQSDAPVPVVELITGANLKILNARIERHNPETEVPVIRSTSGTNCKIFLGCTSVERIEC